LKQEEKVIQPHEERVEIVIPSTAEVRKEVKIGAASEASREQNGSPVEGACGYLRLVVSGYARSSTNVVVHKLPWREDCPLDKQNANAAYQSDFVS
jgi:hypothetical protein